MAILKKDSPKIAQNYLHYTLKSALKYILLGTKFGCSFGPWFHISYPIKGYHEVSQNEHEKSKVNTRFLVKLWQTEEFHLVMMTRYISLSKIIKGGHWDTLAQWQYNWEPNPFFNKFWSKKQLHSLFFHCVDIFLTFCYLIPCFGKIGYSHAQFAELCE